MDYTLNCNGRLLSLKEPQVMGIMNVTPDSFYANSRQQTEEEIARRTEEILAQGGSIIDIGACSTRPGSKPASEAEEAERLRYALAIVRREVPQAIISVDTFRPRIARMAVEEFGADIINDVIYICLTKLPCMTSCLIALRLPTVCAPWDKKTLFLTLALALARR